MTNRGAKIYIAVERHMGSHELCQRLTKLVAGWGQGSVLHGGDQAAVRGLPVS